MQGQIKVKKPFKSVNNQIEQAGEMLREPVKELGKLPLAILEDAVEQIGVKPRRSPMSGSFDVKTGRHTPSELAAGQTDELPERKDPAGNRLFQSQKNQEKLVFSQKDQVIERQVEKLMADLAEEIKHLQSQTSLLTAEVRAITVETKPARAGQYHLSFFGWLLAEIKNIRRKVTHSRVWLQATYAKKQKRGYWQMAKKHGNTFMLSDERTPSGGAG